MSDDEDVGTARWFGESWGAPINDPRTKVDTPIDLPCEQCDRGFVHGERGLTIPYIGRDDVSRVAYHLPCWLEAIGVDAGPEVYG